MNIGIFIAKYRQMIPQSTRNHQAPPPLNSLGSQLSLAPLKVGLSPPLVRKSTLLPGIVTFLSNLKFSISKCPNPGISHSLGLTYIGVCAQSSTFRIRPPRRSFRVDCSNSLSVRKNGLINVSIGNIKIRFKISCLHLKISY